MVFLRRVSQALLYVLGLSTVASLGVSVATAEPTFLSKQYTRCTTCHYSPTGGGLLTPYGRSLSREEISMFGQTSPGDAGTADPSRAEEAFLGGLLGDMLGPLQLGLELRPSNLNLNVDGQSFPDRNFFMNMDLVAAYQTGAWTFYGELGRQPTFDGSTVDSYEHWAAYQVNDRVSVRGGRFVPAYGVRFADHTTFTREALDLAQYGQVYGVEVGVSGERSLVQVSVGPGRADSIVDDDGRQSLTTSGRVQFDLTSRTSLVGSVLHRAQSDRGPRSTDSGVALGFAPTPRVTTWTQFDTRFQDLVASDRSFIFAHQTSVEVVRGIWLRVSPQIRWASGDPRVEVRRLVLGADVYPRTHWHVNLSYYRDRMAFIDVPARTFLAQLHLYL